VLETREIEAFLTVGEELHFGRAAQRLRLSTSRVSNLVRAIERHVGTPLFERTSRVVTLTPPGAQLFTELRAAHIHIEQALRDVRWSAGLESRVLRAGFTTTLPERLRIVSVTAFEGRHPDCRTVASRLPTTDLFGWLGRDWPVDVFVTWMPATYAPVQPRLNIGPVIHLVPRAVMLPAGHPLTGRGTVDIEELAGYEVIYPQLPDWFRELWVPLTTPSGRPLRRRHVAARYIEDVLRLVAQSGLVHVTYASLLSAYQRPGVVVAPLTGLPPMPVRAVWPDGPNAWYARAFAELAREAFAKGPA
jgi:DNA-binding transcriptional LysR family regulator